MEQLRSEQRERARTGFSLFRGYDNKNVTWKHALSYLCRASVFPVFNLHVPFRSFVVAVQLEAAAAAAAAGDLP